MISLLRLEADGTTLEEVISDLDTATRQLGPGTDDLRIHDEHYERVHDTCFKGRRVFRVGEKGVSTSFPVVNWNTTASNAGTNYRPLS